MADSSRFLAKICSLVCLCLLFFSFFPDKSGVYGARDLAANHHKKKSLMPASASVCSAPTKGLQIVHRYGPCSPLGQKNPPPAFSEILLQDQSRVRSLYSTPTGDDESGTGADLPLQENSLGAGNFVVKIGFGTPKQDLTLMFDTGSPATWIQCQPCPNCYNQEEPIFDPSSSSTFSKASCETTPTSTCPPFEIEYHDKSYSTGFYAQDTLTLSSNSVLSDFVFGCGQNNSGKFGKVAGVLGFGQGGTSIMTRTTNSFGQLFCYCLPVTETSTGYLYFGLEAQKTCMDPAITIPLIAYPNSPNKYNVKLVGITIGEKRLADSGSFSRTILDSGTIISRLPGPVYSELRSSFQELMSKYPTAQPLETLLDTCYDLSGYGDDDLNDIVPSMSLHFDDSKDLKLEPSAVFVKENDSQTVCLAFAENENSDGSTIIGNHQQRNLKISYDILQKQVGISSGGCGN